MSGERLTVAEVEKRVAFIKQIAADDERAHLEEDLLHGNVLQAIAAGQVEGDVQAVALAALQTLPLDFARWCA